MRISAGTSPTVTCFITSGICKCARFNNFKFWYKYDRNRTLKSFNLRHSKQKHLVEAFKEHFFIIHKEEEKKFKNLNSESIRKTYQNPLEPSKNWRLAEENLFLKLSICSSQPKHTKNGNHGNYHRLFYFETKIHNLFIHRLKYEPFSIYLIFVFVFFFLQNLITVILLILTVTVTRVLSKALPGTKIQGFVLITPIDNQMDLLAPIQQFDDNYEAAHLRSKREAYDPYDAYYFYPKTLNRPQYDRFDPISYDGDSLINRRDVDDENRIETKNGQKYKYTPLFQLKSTQSKRRKLFVPNLFG